MPIKNPVILLHGNAADLSSVTVADGLVLWLEDVKKLLVGQGGSWWVLGPAALYPGSEAGLVIGTTPVSGGSPGDVITVGMGGTVGSSPPPSGGIDGGTYTGGGGGGGAGTALIDHFTDGDGTPLVSHAMDTGPGWTVASGILEIQSGAARTALGGGALNYAYSNAGLHDGTAVVTLRAPSSTSRLGLIFRLASPGNYYIWLADYTTPIAGLLRFDGGASSVVAMAHIGAADGMDHVLRVSLSGGTVDCWYDGTLVTSALDATYPTATRYGFGGFDANQLFDDFAFGP